MASRRAAPDETAQASITVRLPNHVQKTGGWPIKFRLRFRLRWSTLFIVLGGTAGHRDSRHGGLHFLQAVDERRLAFGKQMFVDLWKHRNCSDPGIAFENTQDCGLELSERCSDEASGLTPYHCPVDSGVSLSSFNP